MEALFKPHHFLDLLYELAENNSQFDTFSPTGQQMGYYGNCLAAGEIDTVVFTTGADGPCAPCQKLADGICTDTFTTPEAIAFNRGFTRKYDYNLKMDTDLIGALPQVFTPGQAQPMDGVLAQLREQLTPEMILMTWYRKDRVAMTFRGLEMAIQARKRLKGLSH